MAIISSIESDNHDNNSKLAMKPESQLNANANQADLHSESSNNYALRPTSIDDYIGQEDLKQILKISISAAKNRNDYASMGHVLLYGPPGLGKTSCANLLAQELGTNLHVFSAPALERPKDIIGILMSLNEGDVLFIDEVHRLNKLTEELLYPAIEDFEVDLNTGKDSSSRIMRLKINKFILVGATTKLGYISAPLRDRFTHIYRMQYYTEAELLQIIRRNASLMEINIDAQAAICIAKRGRGTPRIVNRLLRLIRDYAVHTKTTLINEELTNNALDLYKIDKFGLDQMDRKIIRSLQEHYNGGPAGLETIASLIGEDKTTIEDYYEPYLIQSGFLIRTQRGRMLTEKASEIFQSNT